MEDVLTKKQQEFAIRNCGLLWDYIFKMRRKGKIPPYLEDEFISEVSLSFCNSVMKFDEDMGCKFSTYVYGGFDWKLVKIFRGIEKEKATKTFCCKDFVSLERDTRIIKKDHHIEIDVDFMNDILEDLDLTENELSVFRDYHFNNLTCSEIGLKQNLTRQAISFKLRKILRKVKEVVSDRDLEIIDFYAEGQ